MSKNKFKAIKTEVDGVTFASKREAARYGQLKLLEKSGLITRLELQPSFPVSINGVPVFKYLADFAYFDGKRRVIEDAKGMKTPVYRIKKKCVEALYGVKIEEV